MTKRMSRRDIGHRVFDCLTAMDPTVHDALEHTGLTHAQWHNGLAYVREVLAEKFREPVVYDAKTRRYALASYEAEVDTYVGRRINEFLIALHRIYDGSFTPSGAKFETRKTTQYQNIDRDVQRLIQQLEWAREDLGIAESKSLTRRRASRAAAGLDGS